VGPKTVIFSTLLWRFCIKRNHCVVESV